MHGVEARCITTALLERASERKIATWKERVHAREEEWRNFIRKTSRERRRRRRLRRTHVGSAWVRREDPAHKLRTRAEHAECYEEAVISKGCLA